MINNLDPSKTYIAGSVECHDAARRIQQVRETSVPVCDRWCHVSALFFDGEWKVIEAKFPEGCREVTYAEIMANVENVEASLIVAVETPLDILSIRQHVGKEFATRYALQWLKGIKDPNEPRYQNAVFCTEIIRMHDYGILQYPPDNCVPADYQEWAITNNLPMIVLWKRER